MTQYDPHNIDKALKRMEKADELKGIHRSSTNIMSFFDDNDEEHELQKQQSAEEVKKDEYLKSVELLKTLIPKTESIVNHTHLMSFGLLIETTDFLNILPNRKEIIKKHMIWCNKKYEKYLDTPK